MALTIEAVYENGVLRPAEPLPLKEGMVQIRVTLLGRLAAAQLAR